MACELTFDLTGFFPFEYVRWTVKRDGRVIAQGSDDYEFVLSDLLNDIVNGIKKSAYPPDLNASQVSSVITVEILDCTDDDCIDTEFVIEFDQWVHSLGGSGWGVGTDLGLGDYATTNNYFYVADESTNFVRIFDDSSGLIASYAVTGAHDCAYSPASDYVYLAMDGTSLRYLDITTLTPTLAGTITTTEQGLRILNNPYNGLIYLIEDNGTLEVIDPTTNTIVQTIVLGGVLKDLTIDSSNGDCYIVRESGNSLIRIASSTYVLQTLSLSNAPSAVGYCPQNGFIYVGYDSAVGIEVYNKSFVKVDDIPNLTGGNAISKILWVNVQDFMYVCSDKCYAIDVNLNKYAGIFAAPYSDIKDLMEYPPSGALYLTAGESFATSIGGEYYHTVSDELVQACGASENCSCEQTRIGLPHQNHYPTPPNPFYDYYDGLDGRNNYASVVSPQDRIIPFQIRRPKSQVLIDTWSLADVCNGESIDLDESKLELINAGECDFIIYDGSDLELEEDIPCGLYQSIIAMDDGSQYASQLFYVKDNTASMLKIEWWNSCDIETVYYNGGFRNWIYIDTSLEVLLPQYSEEGVLNGRRDFKATFQKREQPYRAKFHISRWAMQVITDIMLHDNIQIVDGWSLKRYVIKSMSVASDDVRATDVKKIVDVQFTHCEDVVKTGCCEKLKPGLCMYDNIAYEVGYCFEGSPGRLPGHITIGAGETAVFSEGGGGVYSYNNGEWELIALPEYSYVYCTGDSSYWIVNSKVANRVFSVVESSITGGLDVNVKIQAPLGTWCHVEWSDNAGFTWNDALPNPQHADDLLTNGVNFTLGASCQDIAFRITCTSLDSCAYPAPQSMGDTFIQGTASTTYSVNDILYMEGSLPSTYMDDLLSDTSIPVGFRVIVFDGLINACSGGLCSYVDKVYYKDFTGGAYVWTEISVATCDQVYNEPTGYTWVKTSGGEFRKL